PVFSVRLADARGAPDASLVATNGVEASAAAAESVAAATKVAAQSKPKAKAAPRKTLGEGHVQVFERLVSATKPKPEDQSAYSRYMVATGGDDPTVHRARNLAEAAADAGATIPRLLAAAELAEDRNQRARWIERAEKLV